MATRKSKQSAARSLAGKLGWIARRAKSEGKSPDKAKAGYLGWVKRAAREEQRAKPARGRRAPGAAPVQRLPDGSLSIYAAPRTRYGDLEPQPALGQGSVTDDLIRRKGAKVTPPKLGDLAGVEGLQTVRGKFRKSDDEAESGERTITRETTVLIPKGATTEERSRIIARALQGMARAIVEADSSDTVDLEEADVSDAPAWRVRPSPQRRKSRAKGAGEAKPKYVKASQRARATGRG